MATTKNRNFLVVAVAVALMALPMAAHSALVNPITSANGGVVGGGNWETGVSLGWSVADEGDNYLYSYTFQSPTPALSHFILQTSDNFTENNILDFSNAYALDTFSAETQGGSNPGMPEPMFGIKFEGFEGGTLFDFSLTSNRAPMEGDFYAKGGDDSFAYNSGFGALNGANILVPDTLDRVPVPETGALLLFGSGLIGLVGFRRVRRMQ
jgi:hypothetical protein